MKVLTRSTQTVRVGRLSDGSDARDIERTTVSVQLNDGRIVPAQFDGPYTDQDVIDAVRSPAELVPTRKADIEDLLIQLAAPISALRTLQSEALTAGDTALAAALGVRAAALYADAKAAINRWRNAQ